MKVIDASYKILTPVTGKELIFIEEIGRSCYHSEDKMKDGSDKIFVEKIVQSGHESVIEHVNLTVRFVVDRGVSHELVRHRLASYTQESTRYCNYGNNEKYPDGIIFVNPSYIPSDQSSYRSWWKAMEDAEFWYLQLLKEGRTPEEARAVLPNSVATTVTMTANLREWRHVLKLRTSNRAHPGIREVMVPLGKELSRKIPVIFDEFA